MTQPKVKHFCWRAIHDSLPTRVNLYKRGMEVDVYCPCCGNEYETVMHLFLDCDVAREFWLKGLFRVQTEDRSRRDFGDWCVAELVKLDDEKRGLLMNLLCSLWHNGNKWVFEGRRWDIINMINRAVELTGGASLLA